MTDLEMTKLCAEAMGIKGRNCCGSDECQDKNFYISTGGIYDPLHDDAQAMALVKKLGLKVSTDGEGYHWYATHWWSGISTESVSLNRAICECAAKVRAAR